MSTEELGMPMPLDPDAPAGRAARNGAGRRPNPRTTPEERVEELPPARVAGHPAEATLNLEPFRAPLVAMLEQSMRNQRAILERINTDLEDSIAWLREWQERMDAKMNNLTTICQRVAEQWVVVEAKANALIETMSRIEGYTRALEAVVKDAESRVWRRAVRAEALVGAVGLGLIIALCGVVWLALTHH